MLELELKRVCKEAIREEIEELRTLLRSVLDASGDDKLSRAQAAAHAGVSTRVIARWDKAGLLPGAGSGRNRRYRRSDVERAHELDAPKKDSTVNIGERALALLRK